MKRDIPKKIAEILTKKEKTLSIAESCTGGLTGSIITDIPGSSKFFKLGITAYSNESKSRLLKVPKSILIKQGAVNKQVAELMARQVRKIFKTDYGIGITGIAGPTGATKNKPVGLTYISVSSKKKKICKKFIFKGARKRIKSLAASNSLKILHSILR